MRGISFAALLTSPSHRTRQEITGSVPTASPRTPVTHRNPNQPYPDGAAKSENGRPFAQIHQARAKQSLQKWPSSSRKRHAATESTETEQPTGCPKQNIQTPQVMRGPFHEYSKTNEASSTEISGDKENAFETGDGPKKRARPAADAGRVRPNQILSPTSSNSRLTNRDRPTSPSKFQMSRPGSPLKVNGTSRSVAATSVLSSMVERAKATRAKGTRKATTPLEAGRTKRQPATTSRAPPSRPATRAGRRGSATSETSDGSVGTVVRKPSTTRVPTSSRAAAGGVRKATASTAKKAAPKATTAASIPTSASGRVLRKRT